MIASWPGRLPAGATVDAPAMNIDLFPTFLRLAGLELPDDRVIDGRDLWGLMSGEDPSPPHDALLFFDDKVIDGVRSGQWKYYRYADRYYWPVPLDKPGSLTGQRIAATDTSTSAPGASCASMRTTRCSTTSSSIRGRRTTSRPVSRKWLRACSATSSAGNRTGSPTHAAGSDLSTRNLAL